jgi:hypothetical protein
MDLAASPGVKRTYLAGVPSPTVVSDRLGAVGSVALRRVCTRQEQPQDRTAAEYDIFPKTRCTRSLAALSGIGAAASKQRLG